MTRSIKPGPAGDFLPFCRPSIDASDVAAVTETLTSGWITTGPRCAALEQGICDRTGAEAAVAVNSATAAMPLPLHALGVGPGDEGFESCTVLTTEANATVAALHHA